LPKRQESVQIVEEKPIQHVYPVSEPFTGEYVATHRHHDFDSHPIHEHASVYHTSGRSDVKEEPVKEKGDLLGKLSSLFKKEHKEEYPTTVYEGPLSEVHRQRDLDHPFEVERTHRGFYDQLEQKQVKPAQVEEESSQIPAHQPAHYPAYYLHEGPTSETHRHSELIGEPLESHVSVYSPSKHKLEAE
jgi:hypothetical protein